MEYFLLLVLTALVFGAASVLIGTTLFRSMSASAALLDEDHQATEIASPPA
jgi:hypothetical protein